MPLSSVCKVLRLSVCETEEIVEAVTRVLSQGGVVALPSDTLYGLTTMLDNADKLYTLKRRSSLKPLGLFLSSPDDVTKWARSTVPRSLLTTLLPGPVTLLFDRLPSLPYSFNPDTSLVGVRVPDCPIVRAVTKRLGQPLAQTSANLSGAASPVCISDFSDLHHLIDLIVDGGTIGDGRAEGSTVVDLSTIGKYTIVRDGCARFETENALKEAGLLQSDD